MPDDPLAAAARFHAELVPALPAEGDVLLVYCLSAAPAPARWLVLLVLASCCSHGAASGNGAMLLSSQPPRAAHT